MRVQEVILTPDQAGRLREIIMANGKQYEVAEKLSVSPPHISKILKGIPPGRLLLEKILATFNVNRDWFETGQGEPYNADEPQELQVVINKLRDIWPSLALSKRYEVASGIIKVLEASERNRDTPPTA